MSDQDTSFKAELFQEVLQRYGIQHILATTYTKDAAMVERAQRSYGARNDPWSSHEIRKWVLERSPVDHVAHVQSIETQCDWPVAVPGTARVHAG
jgi:hypothetical protein